MIKLILFFSPLILLGDVVDGAKNITIHGASNRINLAVEPLKKSEDTILRKWHLPHFPTQYIDRKVLTDMLWSQLTGQSKTVSLVGLRGMGGVGKTFLATQAIHYPPKEYCFRAWFSAESKDLLTAEYLELGDQLRLFSLGIGDDQKIDRVKKWLESQESCLLVYDNAPDLEMISEFLPRKGHIIITSRNYKLINAVEVDVMTESEALDLLLRLIPKTLKAGLKEQANILVGELGYLPLAISQAGAYMAENMLEIGHYLSLYKTNKEQLLASKTLPAGDTHEAVYVSWDMNAGNIRKLPHGENALALLGFIAYCYPENIPKPLLMQYLCGTTKDQSNVLFHDALRLLRQHSLIKVTLRAVFVHRLVHEWIRHRHSEAETVDILKKALVALQALYPQEDKTTEDIELVRGLVPHVDSILSHLQPLVPAEETIDIRSILGDCYFTLGDYNKSKTIFDGALVLCEKYCGQEDMKTANISYHLGLIAKEMGSYPRAKNWYEKALAICRKHGEQYLQACILDNFGQLWHVLNDLKQAKECYTEAEKLYKNIYGDCGSKIKTATLSVNLCKVYINLGDPLKAKEKLSVILRNKKQLYGSRAHPELGQLFREYGLLLRMFGKLDQAQKYYGKALSVYAQYYAPSHPVVADMMNLLGSVLRDKIEYDKAISCYTQALAINEQWYGPMHPEVGRTINNIGHVWRELGEYDKALACYLRTIEIKTNTPLQVVNVGIGYIRLGELYVQQNKYVEAKKEIAQSLQFFKDTPLSMDYSLLLAFLQHRIQEAAGEYDASMLSLKNILADAQKSYDKQMTIVMQRYVSPASQWREITDDKASAKAIAYYKKAKKLITKLFGKRHYQVAYYNYLLAQSLESEHPAKAKKRYKKALHISEEQQFKDARLTTKFDQNIKAIQQKLDRLK
ncbi:MAG: hypothetical protein A2Y14_04200 [Verrucomicrobia bacterium GWF2_51_19]|nr:MAG: hypothetical protein A2Y14_04200 [Verrucomicrobia bacterium GWF2_51_19]HCJ11810.1 hypothetical protein [Opitutae bacterium]